MSSAPPGLEVRWTHDGFATELRGKRRTNSPLFGKMIGVGLALTMVWCLGAALLVSEALAFQSLIFALSLTVAFAGLVTAANPLNDRTSIEIGTGGLVFTREQATSRISAQELVHAEAKNGHLILTTRQGRAYEIPVLQETDASIEWVVLRIRERLGAWESPVGTAPEALTGLLER